MFDPLLILVGPLPRPYGGISVLLELLREELIASRIRNRVIDVADRGPWPLVPRVIRRSIQWIGFGTRYMMAAARHPSTVYLTIAQSRGGFLRDAAVVAYAAALRHRIVLHVNCGDYGGFWHSQPRWLQRAIRVMLLRARTLIVPSERLLGMFDFEPRLRDRLVVVPNAAPSDDAIAEKELGPDEVRLLFLSSFLPTKGYEEVIRTVGILRREHNIPATCRLVGTFVAPGAPEPDGQRRLVEQIIEDELLDGHVTIHPEAGREGKYDHLRESHFLLLPTRWRGEAQPLAIIEALATGCVPIAPEYRAIPDLIVDGATGVIAGPDPSAIAEAIADLCDDPARYAAIRRRAIAHHRDHFSADAHLRSMLDVLVPAVATVACCATR